MARQKRRGKKHHYPIRRWHSGAALSSRLRTQRGGLALAPRLALGKQAGEGVPTCRLPAALGGGASGRC